MIFSASYYSAENSKYADGLYYFKKQLIGIAHADCKEDAETLEGLIRESCPNAQFLTVKYEPVTGAHVGPGALALFFLSKDRWR